jgi:hypothetical protein
VAGRAGHPGVQIGEGEARRTVVKNSCRPGGDRVAGRASRGSRGEARCNVVRRGRGLEYGLVAAIAVRRKGDVVVVDMAGGAGGGRRGHVGAYQGEPSIASAVIERRGPARRRMAIGAVRQPEGRPGGGVRRGVGLLPGDQMAAGGAALICGDVQVVVTTGMALLARHSMALSQRETDGRLIMLNRPRTKPSVEALMARLALIRREIRRGESVCRRRRALPILHVAGCACCRKSQELSDSSTLVTFVALHHSVRAKQRESVEVLLDRLIRDIPTRDGVALGAIGPHLTAMNVGVAVRAIFPDIREDRLDVALRAGNFFVHAAKGISRGVVVEFRNSANRNPACICVAVLARNGKRAVRAPRGLLLRIRRADEGKCKNKEH